MKRSDLIYDEYGDAEARCSPSLFGCDVAVRLSPDLDGDGSVSSRMLAAAGDIEQLGPQHYSTIASMLYAHAEQCFEVTDYGFATQPGEDTTDANRRSFGVRSPEDAFSMAGCPRAEVRGEDDRRNSRFAVLMFLPPWEDEHGCGVVLRDGEPVGWGDAAVYVGTYDVDDS